MRKVIVIEDNEYDFKQTWDDFTINEVDKLDSLEMPKDLLNAYKTIPEEFNWFDYISYYRAVIPHFCKIPQLTDEEVFRLYNTYFLPFILDIKVREPRTYIYQNCEYIKHKGVKYYLPKIEEIAGVQIIGKEINIVQHKESSDLINSFLKSDLGYKGLALFIATYCFKKDESFNEKLVLQRYDEFTELPMSAAWEVFFYIIKSLKVLAKDLEVYLNQAQQPQRLKVVQKEQALMKLALLAQCWKYAKRTSQRWIGLKK